MRVSKRRKKTGRNPRVEVVAKHSRSKVSTVDQSSGVEDLVVLQRLLLITLFVPFLLVTWVHPEPAFVDLEELVPEGGGE